MNKIKIAIFTILIIILFLLGIKKLINLNQTTNLKNKEEFLLNETSRILSECFDLENKNKRTLNESIKLIEYCLEEYGYKNWFQILMINFLNYSPKINQISIFFGG